MRVRPLLRIHLITHLNVQANDLTFPNLTGKNLDLKALNNLQFLSLRTHDMSAVCASLASLNSDATLGGLTLNALT